MMRAILKFEACLFVTISAMTWIQADLPNALAFSDEKKTIIFASLDSLQITADVSAPNKATAPFIILFHQAGWSRGEYNEIIPKLNAMGFNCMAVDQRSGGPVNGVANETSKRAAAAGKSTTYLDAYQDMQAALMYADENYAKGSLIVWGSSYSAALVIKLASDFPEIVDGVLSFAPGEYFARFGVGSKYITDAAASVTCPVFVTSAKSEEKNWIGFYNRIPSEAKHSFLPNTAGNHGSRALWSKFSDSKDYWQAVKGFLKEYFLKDKEK